MVQINADAFSRRLKRLYESWKVGEGNMFLRQHDTFKQSAGAGRRGRCAAQGGNGTYWRRHDNFLCVCCPQDGTYWNGATAVTVVVGTAPDGLRYCKSASLHLWLLGYEFTGGQGQSSPGGLLQAGSAPLSTSSAGWKVLAAFCEKLRRWLCCRHRSGVYQDSPARNGRLKEDRDTAAAV